MVRVAKTHPRRKECRNSLDVIKVIKCIPYIKMEKNDRDGTAVYKCSQDGSTYFWLLILKLTSNLLVFSANIC